jgi:hypothetical protein
MIQNSKVITENEFMQKRKIILLRKTSPGEKFLTGVNIKAFSEPDALPLYGRSVPAQELESHKSAQR